MRRGAEFDRRLLEQKFRFLEEPARVLAVHARLLDGGGSIDVVDDALRLVRHRLTPVFRKESRRLGRGSTRSPAA